MSGELQFPLECSSCGNCQYFKEVRAQVHEVHFAATHGQVEYGKPENASPPVVLRILCGFCNTLVHDNGVADPVVPDLSHYRDAEIIFRDVAD